MKSVVDKKDIPVCNKDNKEVILWSTKHFP